MMESARFQRLMGVLAACLLVCGLTCCGGQPSAGQQDGAAATEAEASAAESATPSEGTYAIKVDTDSSMFHADSCELTVKDGVYTATLVLPGEGFSRLYFGTAEEAATADDADIYDYYLNDEGKYSFDIPVEALDEELTVAAYGQRRDTWYDHTIEFHAPAADAGADAA